MGPSDLGDLVRRRVAGALLAIGLFAASIAYTGSIVRSIVVDDDLVANAAEAALDDDAVREVLARETATALEDQLFPEATAALGAYGYDVTEDIDAVTAVVLDDPGFTAAFVDGLRGLHRAVLVEHDTEPQIDITPLVEVVRTAAIERNAAYAELLPETADVRVAVPNDRLPDLTGLSSMLDRRAQLAAVVAVLSVAAAFALHPRRPRVIRRVGTWALGVAIVQTCLAFGVSYAAQRLPGDVAPVASTVADTLRPRLVVPAAMMAAAGVALVIGAWRWQRTLDATHERIGAHAFLSEDPDDVAPPLDGGIEVATLRSPMGAPPVPLVRQGGPMVTAGAEPLPTMPRGG